MAQEIPLNGFYKNESQKLISQRCVNFYPAKAPSGGLSSLPVYSPTGVSGPITATASGNLATGTVTSQVTSYQNFQSAGKVVFCKNGFAITTDGLAVSRFSLNTGHIESDYSRMATSPDWMVVITPGQLNSGTTYGTRFDNYMVASGIGFSGFGGDDVNFTDVAFLGGRFIYMPTKGDAFGSDRLYYSNIGDTNASATQFFAPDSSTSAFRGLQVLNGQLWLFTDDQSFLFTNTASTTTPFQWQRSATAEVGLLNAHCKSELKGTLVILGRRKNEGYRVFLFAGSNSQPISTKAIDYEINQAITQAGEPDARVFSYNQKGRDFTAVKVPGKCFVYDHDAQLWHERTTGGSTWEMQGFAYSETEGVFVSRVLVSGGDANYYAGQELVNSRAEFGTLTEQYLTTSYIQAANKPLRLIELEPQVEFAAGTIGTVKMSVSDDFGQTFTTERSLATTDRSTRTRFLNWGRYDQAFTIRIANAGQIPMTIDRLLARISAGTRDS